MRYKLFGRTGLRVSELCLGTMTFGNDWKPNLGADAAQSCAIFEAFANAGGNFIDTANLYSYKRTSGEQLVGEFVRSNRDHFVISTKYSLSMSTDPVYAGNSRKSMMHCLEQSLRRLGTSYVDILWLHMWDGTTPIDEILRGLDDLVSCGKVHYIGISDTPAWRISQAVMLSELRGWSRFCGIQAEYNLLERTSERELLPMARELGLAVCAWSPLAGGRLAGKYLSDNLAASRRLGNVPFSARDNSITQSVIEVAQQLGCTPSQVALSAIRQIGARNLIIPILGARTVEQIEDNLGCLNVSLADDHLHRLDVASAIDLGFPHSIPAHVRALAFGGRADLLDIGGS
jgi:aryl-alcohol dehydrogenase-like predicted oxidoreductase